MEAKRERHEQDAGSAAGGPPVHPMDGAPLYPTESLRDPASSSAYTSYARTDSPTAAPWCRMTRRCRTGDMMQVRQGTWACTIRTK